MLNIRRRRFIALIGIATLVAGAALVGPAGASAGPSKATCTSIDVPVSVLPQPATVHAVLCTPSRPTTTVQVLVAGGTYNGEYWSYPITPSKHNYVEAAVKAGYATLAVDRLGTGASSHPPSLELTGFVEAAALHTMIGSVRKGLGGHAFRQVILVGHSVGSIETVLEAATYRDVDGLILTGYGHHMNYPHLLNVFATSLHPAPLVPGYQAAAPADPGYLTSLPGTRYADFDAPAHVDPAVLAHDEMSKDVFSVGEPADGVPIGVLSPVSLAINAPVAIVVGAENSFFCGGDGMLNLCASNAKFHAAEAPYFSPAAHLTTEVVSGAGHDLNLMDNSASTFQTLLAWSAQHVPA